MAKQYSLMLILAATVILSSGTMTKPRIPVPSETKVSQSGVPSTPAIVTYGAHWISENGKSTDLILKNGDTQNSNAATVMLYAADGELEQSVDIQLPANAVKRISLTEIIKPAITPTHWGGLVVRSTRKVSGEIAIQDSQVGSFSMHLSGGYRYDTENALYAPWWLPDDQTEGGLTLFNTSAQNVTVTPSILRSGSPERAGVPIDIAPNASVKLSLRDMLGKDDTPGSDIGNVTLRYSGPAHSIHPVLLLSNAATGFLLMPSFNGRHEQQNTDRTTWQFPDISLAAGEQSNGQAGQALTAYALVSNGTKNSLTPRLTAFFASNKRNRKAPLSMAPLMPNETRLVDLSRLINTALPRAEITHFAMTASHDGSPGDLSIAVFSTSQKNDVVLTSVGMLQPPATLDTSFWKIGTSSAIPVVQNKNEVDAPVRVMIHYMAAHGVESFRLPSLSVGSHKKVPLILRQAVLSGTLDDLGNKIPSGTISGLVTLEPAIANPEMALPNLFSDECENDCSTEQSPSSAPFASITVDTKTKGITPVSGVVFANSADCPPVISSIDPTSGAVGGDPVITIQGEDFATGQTVSVSGGITAEVQSVNDTGGANNGTIMTVALDIPVDAASGTHTVTVNDELLGSSNSVNFQVGDRTPSITSVVPSRWSAGTTVNVQILGTGFGTNPPTVNISGGGVTSFQITGPNPPSDTEIDVSVTIDPNAPTGSATIEVTSTGYAGNPFSPVPGSSPNSPNFTVQVDSTPASPIVIVRSNDPQQCQGIDLSQQTQTIYAGQQVNLRACLTSLHPGEAIQTATWTINGNVVLFYSASTSKATLNTFSPPDDCVDQIINGSVGAPPNSCTVDPFFWVCPIKTAVVCTYPDAVTAVFEYRLNNGNGASKTVTYNVQGPGNTGVPITIDPDGGTATVKVTSDQNGLGIGPTGITVVSSDGSNGTSAGLVVMASAQLPQDPNTGTTVGSFSWARLFNSPTTVSFIQGSTLDSQAVPSQGPGAFSCSLVNPLDGNPEALIYPASSVAQKNVPNDLLLISGGTGLSPLQGEGGFSRLETVYLFWEPPDPVGNCPSCTIPIPLGAVTFHYSGAATNSLNSAQGTQGWTMNAGCGTGPGSSNPVAGTAFPIWTAKFAVQNCGPI